MLSRSRYLLSVLDTKKKPNILCNHKCKWHWLARPFPQSVGAYTSMHYRGTRTQINIITVTFLTCEENNTFTLRGDRATADPPWCSEYFKMQLNQPLCMLPTDGKHRHCVATTLPFRRTCPPIIRNKPHVICTVNVLYLWGWNSSLDIWDHVVNQCMVSDTHALLINVWIWIPAAAGEVPFSQNSSLILQLCPLDSCGGQPNPCLPLTIICHHIKPVSQQKPWHRLQLKY